MPKNFKCSPPTDKYSISYLEFLSWAITFDANLYPEGSPVSTNIFFIYAFSRTHRYQTAYKARLSLYVPLYP